MAISTARYTPKEAVDAVKKAEELLVQAQERDTPKVSFGPSGKIEELLAKQSELLSVSLIGQQEARDRELD